MTRALSTHDASLHAFITDTARCAGNILMSYFRSGTLRRDPKGAWDLVTDADRASERAIVNAVRDSFPSHAILAEESGRYGSNPDYLWLIDPLDGTLNFSHGMVNWGISIALAEAGEVRWGAFYDPLHDEMFYAERGRGAALNERPIQTSGLTDLAEAVVSVSFAHGSLAELTHRNARLLWDRVMRLRLAGSIGTALGALSSGRMDGAIEVRGGAWDYAAGGLLVLEAGGQATTFEGAPLLPTSSTVLAAATPELHKVLLAAVNRTPPASHADTLESTNGG